MLYPLPRPLERQGRQERHQCRLRVLAAEHRAEDPVLARRSAAARSSGARVIRARITGVGSAVPKKLLTNQDLEKIVDTSDEWITTRTGIKERHIVSEGEKFSDLCTKPAELALKRAHAKAEELHMILVGTIPSDIPFPTTPSLSHRNICAS